MQHMSALFSPSFIVHRPRSCTSRIPDFKTVERYHLILRFAAVTDGFYIAKCETLNVETTVLQ